MSSITLDSSGTFEAKINPELNLSAPPYVFNLVSFFTLVKENTKIQNLVFLEDGRFVVSWKKWDIYNDYELKDKNEFRVYDPSNNFHVDITVTFPDEEYMVNIINVDSNTLIVSTFIETQKESNSDLTKFTLYYKVIKLSKDTYTMNSYTIQENVIEDNLHYYLNKINNKKAFASLSPGGMINIWSAEEPLKTTPIETIDFKEGNYSKCYNQKGNRLVLYWDNKMRIIDLNSYKLIKTIENQDFTCSLLRDFDEKKIIVKNYSSEKETLSFFDFDTEKLEKIENIKMKNCQGLMALRDGNLLLQCDKNKFIVYDVKNGKWSMSIWHDNKFQDFYKINEQSFATVDSNSIYIWKY